MANILEKAATAMADLVAPARHQIDLHQAVFDNEQNEQRIIALCDAAGVVLADYRRWSLIFSKRVASAKTLAEEVPQLEELAREAEKVAEAAKAAVPDELPLTVGLLRGILNQVDPKAPSASIADLAAGLPAIALHARNLDFAAARVRRVASDAKHAATRFLQETADAPPDPAATSLRQQIEGAERRISERRPIIMASEAVVSAQRLRLEGVISGRVSPPLDFSQGMMPAHDRLRRFLADEKGKLSELIRLAAGRENALRENERDRAELTKLQAELQAANAARRERMMAPKAMRFD